MDISKHENIEPENYENIESMTTRKMKNVETCRYMEAWKHDEPLCISFM